MENKLLKGLYNQNRLAQRKAYDLMLPKLHFVCRRYLRQESDIEEALSNAFIQIFKNIDQLEDEEKFEAWARKITVNSCLAMLRKKKMDKLYLEENMYEPEALQVKENYLLEEDLMSLLDALPEGAKSIFNLYVIEGYTHKEIAKKLNISEGTSKSQLNVARGKLQTLVNRFYYTKVN